MFQQVKGSFAVKRGDLSSIPGTLLVEVENQLLKVVLQCPHVHCDIGCVGGVLPKVHTDITRQTDR